MTQRKINILSTRPIRNELIEEASKKGIAVDILSFVDTEPIETIQVQQEIEQALLQSATVVFTSMNAIEAVAAKLEGHQPDWSIYTMGTASLQLVKKYFSTSVIAGTATSAAALAEIIAAETAVSEIIFFCGDQRRDELPSILRASEIEVTEIEVYSTIATPHKLSKQYDGILFFSPSAAQSFFSTNKLTGNTILFAIGNTTAQTIKKYTANTIIISDAPGKENLVQEMIGFFGE